MTEFCYDKPKNSFLLFEYLQFEDEILIFLQAFEHVLWAFIPSILSVNMKKNLILQKQNLS